MQNRIILSVMCMVICFTLFFSGCVSVIHPEDNPSPHPRGFYMGILPNPLDGQEFEELYTNVSSYVEWVPIWSNGVGAKGFWDYNNALKNGWKSVFLDGYIRENDMFPLVHFSFIDKINNSLVLKTPPMLAPTSLSDEAWRTLYKESILDVVKTTRPRYVSVGNEVNRWYEQYGINASNPNGFQHFISLYDEVYDAIKDISPETQVFCVFSREIVSENRQADLSVLSLFDEDKLDLLMFTTYPFAVQGINIPSDIPLDYYSEILQYIPRSDIGFSEIGWSTNEAFGGEKGQYDFLMNLSSVLTIDQGIDLTFFGYCWLHDLEGGDQTGLIDREDHEKMGYLAWKQISNSSLWSKQPNQQIIFMSRADSDEGELYRLDKNGTITRLTNNNRHENNPALSFDGKKIAYHAGEGDDMLTWEIYTLDLDTLIETKVTDNNILDGHPDWSPDGTRIVFASFMDSEGNPSSRADIYLIDCDGKNLTRLTSSEWEDNDPEWSPDGTMIAFKSNRNTKIDAREEIYVMDANGENIRRLTTTVEWESDHDPSWSPDSKQIAYMHYAGSRPWMDLLPLDNLINHWDELTPWNSYVVDLNGSSHQVTDEPYIAQLAVFSKDGSSILYLNNEFILKNDKLQGILHHFTIINPDGTIKQQLLADDRYSPTVEYFDW